MDGEQESERLTIFQKSKLFIKANQRWLKVILILLLVLALLFLPIFKGRSSWEILFRKEQVSKELINPGFEEGKGKMPEGWSTKSEIWREGE